MLSVSKTNVRWNSFKRRLLLIYVLLSILLLAISILGQIRLLHEVGRTFGGFIWGFNTDSQLVVLFTIPSTNQASSLMTNQVITSVNGESPANLSEIYQQARPGQSISYTLQVNGQVRTLQAPVVVFTGGTWFENYGLAFIAGLCWLLIGGIFLYTAHSWTEASEGLTTLPAAMLFLLFGLWGNIQSPSTLDVLAQLLWFPAFALLGASFLHLSLNYRPQTFSNKRAPRIRIDGLPYLPLIALEAFYVGLLLIRGDIPTEVTEVINLGYGLLGAASGCVIGLYSLLRIGPLRTTTGTAVQKQVGYLLALWIGGICLAFGVGLLPVLITGQLLFPLAAYLLAGTIAPLILLYAVSSVRLSGRLQENRRRSEEANLQLKHRNEDLQRANGELQRATSLLLNADAHLRSLLSERIHDQPKQQALRIRSLLGHWQHKLKVEVEHDSSLQSFAQPIIEALGKVRKISEELESDLRGIQLLIEDTYQRRNLGLKLHLEKLIHEDLPAIFPESPLKIQADLWALDTLNQEFEQTPEGEKFAEAISFTITQALLNIYHHAGATFAAVRTVYASKHLEIFIIDDGRGFDITGISPEKTSLLKAELKAREAGGTLLIRSTPRPLAQHGTTVSLKLSFPAGEQALIPLHADSITEPERRSIGRNPS
jgi:hypothetical protein